MLVRKLISYVNLAEIASVFVCAGYSCNWFGISEMEPGWTERHLKFSEIAIQALAREDSTVVKIVCI